MNLRLLAILIFWAWEASVLAGTLNAVVTDTENNPIRNAVVMATPVLAQKTTRTPPKSVVIDQVDKEFIDHVSAIAVGTPVLFPNKDNIRHHVYSFSPSKPFELPLYSGTPAKPVIFNKPGIIKLGCNIHDWMVAYIYVSKAPYFNISNEAGKATLTNLPAGEYTLQVWHPRMQVAEDATRQAVVIDNADVTSKSWQLALKHELRPRRAPLPIQQGY